ncbi:MAG: hypothetical protein DME22_12710 [Verrucomicrobia bacterium]|nr:MAG: hypothetical protein DME22_12710 [Verrucomicrobiota bacterium]
MPFVTNGNADRTGPEAAWESALSGATPLITVAICTRNRAASLQKAVDSVLPQLSEDIELLIVDNASTDNTPEVAMHLAAANRQVTVCLEDEVGLSAARNKALLQARGQYVLFLDDDAVAEPGWLAAYHQFLSAPPSGRIAVVGGAVLPEFEVAPPRWLQQNGYKLDLGNAPKRVSARGGPWGGNSSYRRDVVLKAGMFNTRLGRKGESLGGHEESDLNQRLEDAGCEIWWLGSARIRHFEPAERVRLRWHLRSQFNQGRSSVIMRAGHKPQSLNRRLYAVARLFVAPFQFAALVFLAVLALALAQRRLAASSVIRAARVAGFALQLGVQLVRVQEER